MDLTKKIQDTENKWNELQRIRQEKKETLQNLSEEINSIDRELLVLKGQYDAYTELANEQASEDNKEEAAIKK